MNNAKDRDVLFNIMTKVITKGPKPTIHCSAFQEEVSRNQKYSSHRYLQIYKFLQSLIFELN